MGRFFRYTDPMPIDGPCSLPRLRIVGGSRTIADGDFDSVMDFYGNLFLGMKRLVKHTGALTRYVGFRRRLGGRDVHHVFGIEARRIADIPAGMTAWDLGPDAWTSWESRDGRMERTGEGALRWDWTEGTAGRSHRIVGEFTAEAFGGADPVPADAEPSYWMAAHAWVRPAAPETDDDVRIVEYDPAWPDAFLEMKEGILGRLGGDGTVRIEHIGSTAVPGMPAKPVIDILVEVPSFREARRRLLPRYGGGDWEYWWDSGHMVFIRRDPATGRRTHHLHLATPGHEAWDRIAFRDWLRTHGDDAARYAALKRELAAGHQSDRERYTQAKTGFVRELTDRALGRR